MFALLFFLVATVTGIVIITAAATTSGQLDGLKANQQAQFSASSAARSMGTLFADASCSVAKGTSAVTCTLSPNASKAMGSQDTYVTTATPSMAAASVWSGSVPQVVAALVADASASPGAKIAKVKTHSGNAALGDVTIKITVRPTYDIEFECTYADTTVLCQVPAAVESPALAASSTNIRWMQPVYSRPASSVTQAGGTP